MTAHYPISVLQSNKNMRVVADGSYPQKGVDK